MKLFMDDKEVMHVKSFGKYFTETLKVGYDPSLNMTERDFLYLDAHNIRRKEWHESNNVSYVPLTWSHQLADESRIWAEKLLVNCSISGIEHEHGISEGENLAKNVGSNEHGWGQLYPPNNIVGRWVDFEVKRPYPGNAHLTQALWRPSKYMGCGESVQDFRGGKCRVQVCRYARAGNCDMSHFNATFGKNWLKPMLADSSRCGPNCSPDGKLSNSMLLSCISRIAPYSNLCGLIPIPSQVVIKFAHILALMFRLMRYGIMTHTLSPSLLSENNTSQVPCFHRNAEYRLFCLL